MKTTLLISALVVSSTGCAIDHGIELDDVQTADLDDEGRPAQEKLAANALSPADLAAVTIPVGQLTQSYVNSLATTKPGREALVYLVGCGLSAGNSITATYVVNGQQLQLVLQGSVGLMSNWKLAVPTQDQQRAISGCVLSRMNLFSRNLTISMRGPNYSLDSGEVAGYPYQEGTFFGNVFSGSDNYWGSCDSDAGGTHPWRQCAQSGQCSPINHAGSCTTACTLDANGDATSCSANGTTYSQPASVWLSSLTI